MAVMRSELRGARVADLGVDALDVAELVNDGDSVVEALATLDRHARRVLVTYHDGRPFTLTRADLDLVLPSPASGLDRHEIPELLRRITVRQALGAPARVAAPGDTVGTAVRRMRDGAWRPLVVLERDELRGVLTAEGLLGWLVLHEGAAAPPDAPVRVRQEPWFQTVLPPAYPAQALPYVLEGARRRESIMHTAAWVRAARAAHPGEERSALRRWVSRTAARLGVG